MNVNDAEIISAILKNHNYQITDKFTSANIVLIVTCAIREGAEQKIWNRLIQLKSIKSKKKISKIGLLGKKKRFFFFYLLIV